MKISRLSIVVAILILLVVTTAGCSSKPKIGSTVNSSSVFSTNFKWVEYNTTDYSIKIEKSDEDYQGSPAVHIKTTLQMNPETIINETSDPDAELYAYNIKNSVNDIYYDKLMKNVLGGTENTTYLNSQTSAGIPLSDSSFSGIILEPDLYLLNTITKDQVFTYEGTESITVPAGTYSDADLYTVSTNGVQSSYWMASGIPVPVKIQDSTGSTSLVGWG